VTGALAAVLCLWVGFYRFNTLGGALGGFDDDHFLHFAYAKEVEAGAQPLRDFLDAGLQGARPSLTYELSAWSQELLGDNLRSEALLTVTGVAVGAAVTFVAGSVVAAVPAALGAAVLSALVAPKLYGYPKVLVLAVTSLLIVLYPRRRTWTLIGLMAVWTAVAFLFRHDYALYCAAGCAVVVCGAHSPIVHGIGRAAAATVLTAGLLAFPLWWVERQAGLRQYFANALAMGRREAERTDVGWPVPVVDGLDSLTVVLTDHNATAWLYYLFLALPAVTLAVVAGRWATRRVGGGETPARVALAVMTLLLCALFLRGNLDARFGDMAPPVAVLGAACFPRMDRSGSSSGVVSVLARSGLAAAVVLATVVSIWRVGSVTSELNRAGFRDSLADVLARASKVSADLALLPNPEFDPTDERMAIARHLSRCTNPGDRVFMATYAPEVPVFAGRRFAGGRVSVIPGFYPDEAYTPITLARLESERVPAVIAEEEPYYRGFPRLLEYLRLRYEETRRFRAGGRDLRVLTRHGLPPAAGCSG
jgi:hypothetical protein